jgi:hypothetical protein
MDSTNAQPTPAEPVAQPTVLQQIASSSRVQALLVSIGVVWLNRLVAWLHVPPEDAELYLELASAVATAVGISAVAVTIQKIKKLAKSQ